MILFHVHYISFVSISTTTLRFKGSFVIFFIVFSLYFKVGDYDLICILP